MAEDTALMESCNLIPQNITRGDSLKMECDSPEKIIITRKGEAATGFLIPYVIVGDRLFGANRWNWWLERLAAGNIFDGDIPQVHFGSARQSPDAKAAIKHIENAIHHLAYRNGEWNALGTLIDWILWGLGEGNCPDISDESHEWLYKNFQIGLLQKCPYDYFADIISESRGNSKNWNPTAFFPTPFQVTDMMAMMQFEGVKDTGKKHFNTVCDPAVGTARMLLSASNFSIFLFGQDIDRLLVKITKINLHLYAPWGSLNVIPIEEPPYYRIPQNVQRVAFSRLLAAQRCWNEFLQHQKSLPAAPLVDKPGEGASLQDYTIEVEGISRELSEEEDACLMDDAQKTLF